VAVDVVEGEGGHNGLGDVGEVHLRVARVLVRAEVVPGSKYGNQQPFRKYRDMSMIADDIGNRMQLKPV
jgi:hypothetical protein